MFTLVKSKSVRSPVEPFPITLGDSLTLVELLLVATARLTADGGQPPDSEVCGNTGGWSLQGFLAEFGWGDEP